MEAVVLSLVIGICAGTTAWLLIQIWKMDNK